ncbi:sigma-54-dependent Fis family transcriptional regulator [Acidocella aromatica]|uniref:Transcriptional regulator of acetoin/glycerol metabolism n=1 Tax=Acidocella aromatica TaxID=1303579 RepID=A0A840VBC2_9PROT|nr:sigma-54-dependent Fis family transcriptional regulator [Acidocella aromatica]MBB5373006.1 transcriptional regulator of acetoin/glycerol metabolism [Acidocella aromatica]
MIEDSWRRCLEQGVNPRQGAAPLAVAGDGLYSLRQRHAELIEAARPVMEHAREFLHESGTVMVLTDSEGVILWMEGDEGAKDKGLGIQLVPGGIWGETKTGTNAIGTALASGQPVQICAEEHYCATIKRWTCSANVIRDPYDGQIVGILDISGLSGSHNTHCLALAVTGAGRIESRLAKIEMEKRARLLEMTYGRSNRWSSNGLVIFDRRGRLVRANEDASIFLSGLGLDLKACEALDIGRGEALPRRLPSWLKLDWVEPVVDRNERLGTVLALPSHAPRPMPVMPQEVPETVVKTPAAPFDAIVGASQALFKVKNKAQQLARLTVPVLLMGPTGAGKEVFARALHEGGTNPGGPFVPVNCGGMTRDLLASELFGYAEGAFTGARRGGMIGKFEAANGGALFLDEIGEMPLELQTHFLRVLEGGEVYRLGENKPRKVSVRLIAATNRDLRADVAAGKFRMDLFYRLAVTVLHLPGLAERREDMLLLARHFADATARRYGVQPKYPSPEVLEIFQSYSWPGNLRELRNLMESMVLLSTGDALTVDDLPPEFFMSAGWGEDTAPATMISAGIRGRLADSERQAILAAIQAEGGNLTRAAGTLGIAKSTLYEKMKRYGIHRASSARGA